MGAGWIPGDDDAAAAFRPVLCTSCGSIDLKVRNSEVSASGNVTVWVICHACGGQMKLTTRPIRALVVARQVAI